MGSLRDAYNKVKTLLPKPWRISLELISLIEEMGAGSGAVHALSDAMGQYILALREFKRSLLQVSKPRNYTDCFNQHGCDNGQPPDTIAWRLRGRLIPSIRNSLPERDGQNREILQVYHAHLFSGSIIPIG